MRALGLLFVLVLAAPCLGDQLSGVVADGEGRRIFLIKNPERVRLVRVNRDGTIDPAFSVTVNRYLEHDYLAISPDGSLVIVGQVKRNPPPAHSDPFAAAFLSAFQPPTVRNQLVVVRISASGTIQSTQELNAVLDCDEQITAVALTDAREVLLAGSNGLGTLSVQRLLPSGPDADFGRDGARTLSLGRVYPNQMIYGVSDLRVLSGGKLRLVVRLVNLDALDLGSAGRCGRHAVIDISRDGKSARAANRACEPDFRDPFERGLVAVESRLSAGARHLFMTDLNARGDRLIVRRVDVPSGRGSRRFGVQVLSGITVTSLNGGPVHLLPSGEISFVTRDQRDLLFSDRDPAGGGESVELRIQDFFDPSGATCSSWLAR